MLQGHVKARSSYSIEQESVFGLERQLSVSMERPDAYDAYGRHLARRADDERVMWYRFEIRTIKRMQVRPRIVSRRVRSN